MKAGHTATKIAFASCRAGTEVAHWKLTGAGHVWPGGKHGGKQTASAALLGPSTSVVDANAEKWRFFSRHPLPG